MREKIFLLSIVLFLTAAASAKPVEARGAAPYAEQGYFSVEIPAGWEKEEQAFGLSQEEKKVFGANFLAPGDGHGPPPRISVHYYAPGNILHRTEEKFIHTHAQPVLGLADDGEQYGPVKKGRAGKYPARIFERTVFTFVPPRSIDQKKIPVVEKFAVVPARAGFYVLRLSSPAETFQANLKAYESVVASFNMLAH